MTAAVAMIGVLTASACAGTDDAAPTAIAGSTATTSAPTTPPADPAIDPPPVTTAPTATSVATTEPTASTEPVATTDPTEGEDPGGPPVNTSPDGRRLLDFEFQPVPPGEYRVETIGAPFTIDIPDGWFVQPNSLGHFVITARGSVGPGDRDIVMIRPSNLADPDQPGTPADEQAGDWPLDDIDGWLEALIPGVLAGEPTATTLGGLDAVRFDVAITEEVECGEFFCVGFATNRLVNDMWFDRRTGYRVWWIDGGDEAPIAVLIGDGSDPSFTERATEVLDSLVFERVGPNPIPAEGNLWELGISSQVPAGTVNLPVGPGVTFELSEPHFVFQDELFSGVALDGPGEADIFFPDVAFDGQTLATAEDVMAALERLGFTTDVAGTRSVSGFDATEVDIAGPEAESGSEPALQARALPGAGWFAPPEGTLWIMETPGGLAVITAEAFEPVAALADARALAEEILDSIVIGG